MRIGGSLRTAVSLAALALSTFCVQSSGQVQFITDSTSTPIPGAGHDYIHSFGETVNPANGSVSIRLTVPTPSGRGLSLPFSFAYDSNGVNVVHTNPGSVSWTSESNNFLSGAGWSYSMPLLSWTLSDYMGTAEHKCQFYSNYVFQDPNGGRHSWNGNVYQEWSEGTPGCANYIEPPIIWTDGYAIALQQSGNVAPTLVSDAQGHVYHFPYGATEHNQGDQSTQFPDYIEDSNGNQITINDLSTSGQPVGAFTVTDTLGRSLLASSGFASTGNTVSVSGLANPYTLTWGTVSHNFTTTWTPGLNPEGSDCSPATTSSGSSSGVSAITLPNGKQYTFQYDPTYGTLSQIKYPDGGTVTYTWGLNSQAAWVVYPTVQPNGACGYVYDKPAITKRVVSFDGVTPALEQDFSYKTSLSIGQVNPWSSKTTTITTTDKIPGVASTTVYTYSPFATGVPWFEGNNLGPSDSAIPLEQSIVYSNSGGTLKTVTKTWNDPYTLKSETTSLDGSPTSQVVYTYTSGGLVTEKDEYDYGQSAPTRKTITNYQAFGNPVIYPSGTYMFGKPCQTITYDGSGNRYAETDYFYDSGSTGTVCGAAGTPSVAGLTNLTGHDETNYSASSTAPRGNPTQKTFWSRTGTSPTGTYAYDETGQVVSFTDPCGQTGVSCSDMTGTTHVTSYYYTDNYSSGTPPGNTNAYLTKVTNPLSQSTSFAYSYNDGQLTSSTDPNTQTTSYKYNTPPSGCSFADGLDRLSEIDHPDKGKTTYCYNDSSYNAAAHSPSVTTTKAITSSLNAVSTAARDGYGHTIETILSSDPDGTTYGVTSYAGIGQPYQAYNATRCSTPSCGETTWGVTTYTYDILGRTTQIAKPDGSAVSTTYSSTTTGHLTNVTDEAGNQRTTQNDAFGRNTFVWEAPHSVGYNLETDYQYDVLNNLLCAVQKGTDTTALSTCASAPVKWRPRSFAYDSLSRLLSATNPESGTITYTYDANGNVATEVAPRANQTGAATTTHNYSYDVLNRLTQHAHLDPNGGTEKYAYDGNTLTACGQNPPTISSPTYLIGRRSAMCAGKSGSSWSFDPMGRPLLEMRTNLGSKQVKLGTSYTYNLDGSLKTLTYPSGDVVTYTVGGAGRETQLSDPNVNFVGFSGNTATYAPNGSLAGMINGYTSAFAGIVTSNIYSDRLQPILLSAGVGQSSIFSLCYSFNLKTTVNNGPCSFTASTGDNGTVSQIKDNLDSTRSAVFTYDPLNRLSQANTIITTGANCWGEVFTIDYWGNMTNRSGVPGMTGCSTEGFSTTASTNNQLTGLSYDAAGNVTNDGIGNTPTYDAENRMATDAGVTYSYDADGYRMEKSSGTMYWPGPSGTLTETDLTGTINEEYIYFNGARIARVDRPSGVVHYYFSDELDSASVITDALGNVQQQYFYYPYGGLVTSIGSDSNHYKFNGKERDSESTLDEFGARYYASNAGRFMTPDWAARPTTVPYAEFGDPQSLNLYGYVRNDPVSLGDADGHTTPASQDTYAGMEAGCYMPLGSCPGPSTKTLDTSKAQNTVTVRSTTTTTTEHQDGSATIVSTTTTATFRSDKGHEGEFKNATSETVTTEAPAFGSFKDPVSTTTGPQAISFGQASKSMGADRMAEGVAAAIPGKWSRLPHQAAQDVSHHPLGTLGIVVRSAGLPVGFACPWCGAAMLVGGEALATADAAKDATPYP